MTDSILVEPAGEHRRDFARWAITQDPRIETASQSGFNVPLTLFGDVPEALLDGALVDGRVYRSVVEGLVPDGAGYAPEEPTVQSAPRRRTRKGGAE